MADVLTPDQRRRNMQAIRGRDTKPEMFVRRLVHKMGYRFRLHRKDLPGRPDLVLPQHRRVIYVHGCYWHVHTCRWGQVVPKTNAKFWATKRAGNVERDKNNRKEIESLGWSVLVVWECETREAETLRDRLAEFLAPTELEG